MSRALLARSAAALAFLLAFAAVGVGVIGYLIGYRPVVITTGSMGDTAPPGSLLIAQPTPADEVATGDVLVMQRPGAATVTHRVVAIDPGAGVRQAITKGDANENEDPDTYPLEGTELVAARIFPWVGFALVAVGSPLVLFVAMVLLVGAASWVALRAVWRGSAPSVGQSTRPSGP